MRVTRHIAPDHPAFAGHFPGAPVLPGVSLLAEVFEALREQPVLALRIGDRPSIAAAKFHAPVGPGATLTIELHEDDSRSVRFEVRSGGTLAASGRLTAEAA